MRSFGIEHVRLVGPVLVLPLPNANPITAEVCAGFCARMLEDIGREQALVKAIRQACLNRMDDLPRAGHAAWQPPSRPWLWSLFFLAA